MGISQSYKNILYKFAGVFFLFLAKAKHTVLGYRTPRTFAMEEYDMAVRYDISVVDKWLQTLCKYTNNSISIKGQNVLELGPGADLGVGLYILHKGALKYTALDKHNLVDMVTPEFYEHLFAYLKENETNVDIPFLKAQLELAIKKKSGRINYKVRKNFDLSAAIDSKTVDIVFSQAVFEHFENVELTVRQLSEICKPGAIFIALIDLKTHSRWIRDKDPNNIYRYSDRFYNLFQFSGIPNRMRPYQYKHILKKHGWNQIKVVAKKSLSKESIQNCRSSLNSQFNDYVNQMDYLSVWICAKLK